MSMDNKSFSLSRQHIVHEVRFLVGVIADEETTIGFLLAGIGEVDSLNHNIRNYLIVEDETPISEIEEFFVSLYNRKDIGAILIGSDIFRKMSQNLTRKAKKLPILLEIPTKKTIVANVEIEEDEEETEQ